MRACEILGVNTHLGHGVTENIRAGGNGVWGGDVGVWGLSSGRQNAGAV